MFDVGLAAGFCLKATARSRVAASQMPAKNIQLSAANALATPIIAVSLASMGGAKSGEASKGLSCNVNDGGHGDLLIGSMQIVAEAARASERQAAMAFKQQQPQGPVL